MDPLTAIQTRILDTLRHRADAGEPPLSYRDLCSEFGWSSTGTARDHLRALERKGYLSRPGCRGGRVRIRSRVPATARAPIVGWVRAGRPVSTEEHYRGSLPFPAEWSHSANCFALRVAGDSMSDVGIIEGDHVIIRQQAIAQNGDIVVATLDGETTLKRWVKKGQRVYLVAENPRYQPIEVTTDSAAIHGVVVGLLRAYTSLPRPSEVLGPT